MCPVLVSNVPVRRMRSKELRFAVQCLLQPFAGVDVLLGTIHDTDKSQFQRINATRQDVKSVSACIHQIEFGENADSPSALGVYLPREF